MMTAVKNEESVPESPLKRRIYPYAAAFIVMAVLAAISITIWARTASQPDDFAPEEEVLDFLAGRNFADKGFLKLGFLTDYALDNAADAPPVHYTPQPAGPIIIIGGLGSYAARSL